MTLIYGWVYTTFSFVNRLPQIARNYKRKQTQDLSWTSYICQLLGLLFFFLHGLSIEDPVTIISGLMAMLQTLIIVTQMWIYAPTSPNSSCGGPCVGQCTEDATPPRVG